MSLRDGCAEAVQEWVIGLSETTTGVHDIAHVLHDGVLANSVFENDRITFILVDDASSHG